MKLYLDDVRPAPPGWIPIRTAEDFRAVVRAYDWDEISFDHDLSIQATIGQPCHEETGYDLARWMFDEGRQPKRRPRVHSMNPAGAARLRALIAERWREPGPQP
jgi:hypothetical protein